MWFSLLATLELLRGKHKADRTRVLCFVKNYITMLLVSTDVCLRRVTCPLRVNFEFFIKIAKMDHLELTFIWWQLFSTFKREGKKLP